MKYTIAIASIIALASCSKPKESAQAASEKITWTTNFEAAKTTAAAEKKDLFLEFTGTDWCTWCIAMKREILDKTEFYNATKDKFVFVELDYPKEKTLPAELVAQNKALEKQYYFEGYPTIFLCDAAAKPYAISGYEEGDTVASYTKQISEMQNIRIRRDAAFAAAENAAAPAEKAKLIIDGLSTMADDVVETYYRDELEKLATLDPEGTASFVAERKAAIARRSEEKQKSDEEERQYAKMEPFLAQVEPLIQAKKFAEAIATWEVFDKAQADISADMKQFLLLDIKVRQAMDAKDLTSVNTLCDAYAAAFPQSFMAQNLPAVKESYKKELEAAAAP